jgi:adenosine deaminase CECR1
VEVQNNEKKADRIIRAVREYEHRVTFGNQASEAMPGPGTLDMGGQFLTNKDRIDKESILFQIAHKVPKGGLLHLHFNAGIKPDLLLVQARSIDNIYIRSIRPLIIQDDFDLTEVAFSVLDPGQVLVKANIFSSDYKGNATNWKTPEMKWEVWMPWKQFQQDFKKSPYKKRKASSKIEVDENTHYPPGTSRGMGELKNGSESRRSV